MLCCVNNSGHILIANANGVIMLLIIIFFFSTCMFSDPEILLAEDARKNPCRQFQQTGEHVH